MRLKASPIKGTKDYLPEEMAVRDYVQNIILESYRQNGFQRISTPILEAIERLDKSEGGENLSLIFKILKRGAKLVLEQPMLAESDLVDYGLRYDLTLPLARYYANNRHLLRTPFKAIQMGKVFRAEQPQKGRLREFYQCDIDIIGDESFDAEQELIFVAGDTLSKLGFCDFVVKVNDRRILRSVVDSIGFGESEFSDVCISIDKLDKIGVEGVKKELGEKGLNLNSIEKLIEILTNNKLGELGLPSSCEFKIVESLNRVIKAANELSDGKFKVVYDGTLARGMGYYTGMVFEVVTPQWGFSIAGGGRYDNMIGRFLGEKTSAVGFSIGFERITSIIQESLLCPKEKISIAAIYEGDVFNAIKETTTRKQQGYSVTLLKKSKKIGKQLARLKEEGFDYVWFLGETSELKPLGGTC
ncbi:MAG: histidine--tRNA ligase [Oscillospiraceae bacterium]|jgi:histidyl-tRNA synthetase|nr:histidine--tRNA ligase [Oscillospiraceae bacterium]